MPLFCPSEKRGVNKNLFSLFWINTVSELEMQGIAFIPFEIVDVQKRPPVFVYIHSITQFIGRVKMISQVTPVKYKRNRYVLLVIRDEGNELVESLLMSW